MYTGHDQWEAKKIELRSSRLNDYATHDSGNGVEQSGTSANRKHRWKESSNEGELETKTTATMMTSNAWPIFDTKEDQLKSFVSFRSELAIITILSSFITASMTKLSGLFALIEMVAFHARNRNIFCANITPFFLLSQPRKDSSFRGILFSIRWIEAGHEVRYADSDLHSGKGTVARRCRPASLSTATGCYCNCVSGNQTI